VSVASRPSTRASKLPVTELVFVARGAFPRSTPCVCPLQGFLPGRVFPDRNTRRHGLARPPPNWVGWAERVVTVPAADYRRVTRLADKPTADASPARLGTPGFSATSRIERVDGVRGGAVAILDAPQRRDPPPRRRGERLRRRRHRHAVYKHRLPRGQGVRQLPGGRAAATPGMALRRCGSKVRRPQKPQRRQRKPPLQLPLRGSSTETRRGKRWGWSIAAAGCRRR